MYIQESTFETTLDLLSEKIRKFFRYLTIPVASVCTNNHVWKFLKLKTVIH